MKVFATSLAALVGLANAACPNSCSGHGTCNQNDQCQCYSEGKVLNVEGNYDSEVLFVQFAGADCSLMKCPRGTSWTQVVASSGSQAHKMSVECSDAGTCDTATGMCSCYAGFDGSACQRSTCPGDCNGHGVCQSNKDFAEDYARAMATAINLKQRQPRCKKGATYTPENCPRNIEHNDDYYKTFMVSYDKAWDSGLQFGCKCDSGYTGADCSERECPTSFDPLDSSCTQSIASAANSQKTTKISMTKTNVDSDPYALVWSDLPKVQFHTTTGKLDIVSESTNIGAAFNYLALYEQTNIFYEPKEFKTVTSHFSDMARRCTAFHVSKSVPSASLTYPTDGSFSIAPISADSWMCAYMWDSTMAKTPYCAGRWTSLECSGRGICDKTSGTCTCFAGYTGNDCSSVSELG